jgi:quercetin dioxygenase-like cupin family protein
MLQQVLRNFGSLSLNIMDFPDVGDKLPMHNHDEDTVHITIVARGSLRVNGDGWEITAKAGDIIDWEPGKRHEFVALEPNSRCVNIPKNMLSSAPVEDQV